MCLDLSSSRDYGHHLRNLLKLGTCPKQTFLMSDLLDSLLVPLILGVSELTTKADVEFC